MSANKSVGSNKSSSKSKVKSLVDHLPEEAPHASVTSKALLTSLNDPKIVSVLNRLPLTDSGNAEAFALLYGERFLYCTTRASWLVWEDNSWKPNAKYKALRAALSTIRTRQQAARQHTNDERAKKIQTEMTKAEGASKLDALLRLAPGVEDSNLQIPRLEVTIDEFDSNPFVVAAQNGVIDLRTGEWRQALPSDRVSMQLGTKYVRGAKCPQWEKFLNEIFDNDEELIQYVQRAVGYSLTGSTAEQKIFFCFGDGLNGKSKFLKIVEKLLGNYAGNTAFKTLDADKKSQIGEDLAALKGKRFVTIIETPDDRRLDEARVKSLTGEDSITCRFLHGNPFTYQPSCKIWMAMNYRPLIRGIDKGIWRRIREVPFTQNFEGREDFALEEKLTRELSGILNWAIEGALEWQRMGLGNCETVERATEAYRVDSDHLGKWVRDRLKLELKSDLPALDAYEDYREWAQGRHERPFTLTTWGRVMSQMKFETHRPRVGGVRVTCYKGMRLRTPSDRDEVE